MTLFSIGKDGERRGTPLPNQVDVDANRKAHNTAGITYRTDSDTNYERVIFKNGMILYYDDQNRIIGVDGFIPELVSYPVRIIAKYGYDVFVDILGIDPPTT